MMSQADRKEVGDGYALAGVDLEKISKSWGNTSGLKPLGRAVLIAPYTPERKHSLIQLPDAVLGNDLAIEQRAVVIEAGPRAWMNEDQPRAKPGDKVLVAKFSGYMAVGTADGKQYRFVNDNDIFAGIEVEQS